MQKNHRLFTHHTLTVSKKQCVSLMAGIYNQGQKFGNTNFEKESDKN